MTIRVYFSNFSYFSAETFTSFDAAVAYAKSKGFDAAIYEGDTLLATWGIIGGLRSTYSGNRVAAARGQR